MPQSVAEIAAMMCLCSSGRFCGSSKRKTQSLKYPHKNNHVVLGQVILVVKEEAPGLLWSFVQSNIGATAD
jgi:hypothetical protein